MSAAESFEPVNMPSPPIDSTDDQDERHNRGGPRREHTAYILLGSNISPETNIQLAIQKLREIVQVRAVSSVWETPPEGTHGPNFLNAVVEISTHLPRSLVKSLIIRKIEALLGRVRTPNKYAPRTIDLDILVFDGDVIEPHLWERSFAAVPLAELLPDLVDARSGMSLADTAGRMVEETPIFQRAEIKLD